MSSSHLPAEHTENLNSAAEFPGSNQEDSEGATTPRQSGPSLLPTTPGSLPKARSSEPESDSGSETEKELSRMPGKATKRQNTSSDSKKKRDPSKSSKKQLSDEWSDITEPEERRRIQNRLAQRKFREKAREQKERDERATQNVEHAGRAYHIPGPDEVLVDEDLSGLPWGGLNIQHIVSRGHETASQQGSRRESNGLVLDDRQYLSPYNGGYDGGDGSVEDGLYDNQSPYYAYDYNLDSPDSSKAP